jgi:hypothetical protein
LVRFRLFIGQAASTGLSDLSIGVFVGVQVARTLLALACTPERLSRTPLARTLARPHQYALCRGSV